MPRLQCPRCSAFVDVAPGATPVCLSCGFGSAAGRAAPPAVSAPVAATPAALSAAPYAPSGGAPRRKGAVIAVVAVVGLLVLGGAAAAFFFLGFGGASGGARELSDAEARERVEASLLAAGGALTGEAGDDELRKVTIEAEGPDSPPSGTNDLFGGGLGATTMTIEHGRDGAVRLDLSMQSGALTVAFTIVCTPERQYMVVGGQAYASRKAADPSATDCGDSLGDMGFADAAEAGEAPPFEELEAADATIDTRPDGSVHAEFDEDGQHIEIDVDPDGRVRLVTATGGDVGHVTMEFDYGTRSRVIVPEDFELMPAQVEVEQDSDGALQTWTVTESREEPPLGELEVRVQEFGFGSFGDDFSGFGDGGDGFDEGTDDEGFDAPDQAILATFELEEGDQTSGNLTFRFEDADGDGKLSTGDWYTLHDSALEPEEDDFGFAGFADYEVVLYDVLADGEVNSGPSTPLPSWLVPLTLGILALALRRRQG